ncbi:putative efflux pump antibiotic resistance protein [Exophiala viscosa]|uniref:Efflux pump antibiotic resistance protein n=1 Tax=Exophiala viscosa TaxID=2486360 RepID=A0AAN6IGA8_9EURO|nr:putative efflux pump antibiotic resistance protein [Exophiala viscosa]
MDNDHTNGDPTSAQEGTVANGKTRLSPEKEAQMERRGNENSSVGEELDQANSSEKHEPGKTGTETTEEVNYITGIRLLLVMLSLSLVAFLELLDIAIVATAVPRITSEFHSLGDVGWYGSAYLLANASLQPLAGRLYTHFAAKRIFLSFFALFELGSLLCGVSTSSKMLVVSRAVAGIGSAGLVNGALTILSNSIPLPKRPAYLGGLMGFGQMGVVIGPLIGGAFTEYTTWRWCFYINLPIGGVVAILLVLVRLPGNSQTRELSTIQLLLALEYGGNEYAWNSTTVIGLCCGAGATFIIFLGWEYYKGDAAMVPLSMMKVRGVWSSCVTSFFLFSSMQVVIYYLPIYFQSTKGASPMMSGVDWLPNILSQFVGTLISGIAVTKMGYYLPFVVASSIFASIGHGLLSTLSPTSSSGKWIGYQVIVGFGRALALQMPFVAVQNTLPASMVSISMSVLTFTQTLGGALLLTCGETIFTTSLRDTIPKYAKGVNPEVVVAAGATGISKVVTDPTELARVLVAYSKSIDRVFYLAVACSCADFLTGWGMGWKDIRKEKKKAADPQKEEA